MAKKFLTLNIGAANVSLAEYEAGAKDALKLVGYGVAPLAAPLDGANAETVLAPALLELVRSTGIRPGKVSLAISGQMVFPRFAAIPVAGGNDRFEQMVRYEIEQNIPFPIDEMVCDRQLLGELEDGSKSVLIVATKMSDVESITAAVTAAGFEPELVDVSPLALTNALGWSRPEENCAIILDIGARTSSLVIVEGERVYNRSIPVAGNALTREIATVLGCSVEEAEQIKCESGYVSLGGVTEDADERIDRVAKVCRSVLSRLNAEIVRSINFYRSQQGGGMPSKLYLTGGTALLPQIDAFFAEQLSLEVEFFNPFERMALGPKVDTEAMGTDGAYLATTVGLALHACGAAHFRINLLPPSIVNAQAEKAKLPILALSGVLLIGGLALTLLALNHETEVVNAQREAIMGKLSSLQDYERKVKAATASFDQAESEAVALRALLTARGASVQQLKAVQSSLRKGMWIESWVTGEQGVHRVAVRYWKDRIAPDEKMPLSEVVLNRLMSKAVVVADSVKIAEMSTVGGAASPVQQFVVEVKFK